MLITDQDTSVVKLTATVGTVSTLKPFMLSADVKSITAFQGGQLSLSQTGNFVASLVPSGAVTVYLRLFGRVAGNGSITLIAKSTTEQQVVTVQYEVTAATISHSIDQKKRRVTVKSNGLDGFFVEALSGGINSGNGFTSRLRFSPGIFQTFQFNAEGMIECKGDNTQPLSFAVQFAGIATTGGDPYVTTFQGLQYKLPNIVRSYRLLEYPISTGTLFINASISGLSSEEKAEIGDGLEKDGFFYDQFFVGTQESYAVLDRQLNLVRSHNLHNYTVIIQDTPQPFHCPIQGSSLYVAKIIQVEDVTIELRLFSNPQIRNGVQVMVGTPQKARGLLSSNANPKQFAVKQIQCVKPMNLSNEKAYHRVVKEDWARPSIV
jgi:hypothetical protein